jgi:transcriptional regulator with XRE-family HTH domain
MRIKDARMAQISPHRRPYYPPTERMAILELRAARGWSQEQTADAFLVTAATIASWMKRVDEEGPDALVQLREPVNKFPEFVRYAVRLLKALLPHHGQGQDCATALPGRTPPRYDHGRPYAEREPRTGVVTV